MTTLDVLLQQIVNGLALGMMYALVAVGFTLFFGVLDVIKFSHGDVLTVGAFTALAGTHIAAATDFFRNCSDLPPSTGSCSGEMDPAWRRGDE